MSFMSSASKSQSMCQFETEGNGVFSNGSSSKIPQLAAIEINQGAPFENLSKFTPILHFLEIDDLSLLVEVTLQVEGGYISKTSTQKFDAIGQGNTEEEAIEDIKSAIRLLKEAISSK